MRRMKKEFIKDVIKTKLMGLGIILLGVASIFATDDATVALLLVPLGSLFLFSREKFNPKDYEYLLEDKES